MSAGVGSKAQQLVLLNVGGTSFKMDKSTLARYPECLLAKMVDEFPDIVNQGKELYIDRDPLIFPWILQIHRDGDYRNCVPQMSEERLQKELDFYQLPFLDKLGVKSLCHSFREEYNAAKDLVSRILHEIDVSGLKYMYQWDVYLYHRIVDGKVDGDIRVFVHLEGMEILKHLSDEHGGFYYTLCASKQSGERKESAELLTIKAKDSNISYAMVLATQWFLEFIKTELDKFGLATSTKAIKFYNYRRCYSNYNTFRLQFKKKA